MYKYAILFCLISFFCFAQQDNFTISGNNVVCEGESITLTASGCTGTLSWSNGSTAATISVTPYSSTSYLAFCESEGNRTSTSFGIAVIPNVQLDTASTASCNRPFFTAYNVWEGLTLKWKKDGTVIQGQTTNLFTAKEAGTYTVEPEELAGLWLPQSGNYSGAYLADLSFPTANIGFALGSDGGILKTTDSGQTWQTLQTKVTDNLWRIQMFDANTGWALAKNGAMIKTINGGDSWFRQSLPGNYSFASDLAFVNTNAGWIVRNSVIYRTTDGGANWSVQNSSNTNTLNAIHALDENKAWAVGNNGTALKTTDGGNTWTSVNVGTANSLNDVYFTDATHGWMAGVNNTIRRTNDGGNTWVSANPASSSSNYFYRIQFIDDATGWANSGSLFFKTTDGGATWTQLPRLDPSVGTSSSRFVMLSQNDGVFVGAGGIIARTTDGAISWQHTGGIPKNYTEDIYFVNNTDGFAIGDGQVLLKTNDGGKNWTSRKITANNYYGGHDVVFKNPAFGWIAGLNNDVFRTMDGGELWTRYTVPGSGQLYSIYFIDTTTGWVVGDGGGIYKSVDEGQTWTKQTSGTTQRLRSTVFLNANQGWAVGDNGVIVTTNDGGTNWTAQASGTTNQFQSVQFTSATNGWAAAVNTVNGLYHTTDGGITWNRVIVDPNFSDFTSRVQFVNINNGFYQTSRFVYITTDGGATWKKSYHYGNSAAMYFSDATHGWIGGDGLLTFKPGAVSCLSAPITVPPGSIELISTITSGGWANSSTWSCGTIPTAVDAVRINSSHTVLSPGGYTAKVKNIEMLGTIQYGANNANLQMGQQ